MACSCIKDLTNKNAIDRLHPTIQVDGDKNKQWLVYIRGNKTNPLGVVTKLIEYGGVSGDYTTSDLMDSSNIFYIDYNNDKHITFISDSDTVSKAIISCWTEIFVTSDINYSPESWEGAIIDWPAALLFEEGKDNRTNAELQIVGRLKVLRDIYRSGWKPAEEAYYYIAYRNGKLDKGKGNSWSRFLSFQTSELRDKFFDNYKKMIEQIKNYI